LDIPDTESIEFTWQDQTLMAKPGEMIASALFAHGIRTFGHHHKDDAPQGIFCANGQCAQCMVVANGKPVKACMTPVQPGMHVEPLDGLPVLPDVPKRPKMAEIETVEVPVLILGGGPAGMSAANQLGELGIPTLLVDDKDRLGGKLVLQTHRFFGSVNAVYAGTRGTDIASKLEAQVRAHDNVDIWLSSTALGVFSDQKVGILRANQDDTYVLVKPDVLLVATGAREKSLVFPGNTLPGVYGAGAFQTLVNRDLIRAARRLFIVGGGNVGLIAGYHALQAGIEVVGLVEALPECGGYKVHEDKLHRLGVPIYTSHTIVSANGEDQVESVTIAEIDEEFNPIPGTERSFACDTVLIAVGLDPVNEFTEKAERFGMTVVDAGDAQEIAEASAAMFTGKIAGRKVARALGHDVEIPEAWHRTAEILKSHPGHVVEERVPEEESGVFPVFHCSQEIPCNPCTAVCPQDLIRIPGDDIRQLPEFLGPHVETPCVGCEQCITVCPGLAITLVDYRKDAEQPTISIPYEFSEVRIAVGDTVTVLDRDGQVLGDVKVAHVRASRRNDHTVVVKVKAPKAIAKRIAGIRVQAPWVSEPMPETVKRLDDDTIVCRCERVTAGEIRALIRQGCRDVNEIKAVTRAQMGSCGGKTCAALIRRLFREEGIPLDEVEENTKRPLFVEVPLGTFAGATRDDDVKRDA
jgi:NADPH-dependent 2,4-dienoyl-CoA reductase/sulfur reductase-like enzyme/NAD-dependent dihydropyrimidine dehydrogenase PreA subunit